MRVSDGFKGAIGAMLAWLLSKALGVVLFIAFVMFCVAFFD